MKKAVLLYGICGGLLIALLKFIEYRFLVLQHAVEIYAAIIAALFAAIGIWLGQTLTRRRETVVVREIPVAVPLPHPVEVPVEVRIETILRRTDPFEVNEQKVRELGVTPRELEILGLIASGMSNREIAEALFVSENTVKTHSSRLLDKLSASRRTQAVQFGKTLGLIP